MRISAFILFFKIIKNNFVANKNRLYLSQIKNQTINYEQS